MDAIAWASSAMVAARSRLEAATRNLANASTDGFARIVVRGRMTSSGVAVSLERAQGRSALRRTGRDFDLAIAGPGAFRVRVPGVGTQTTRAGGFVRERDGTLRDAEGRTLLGRTGPLQVPDGARIERNGSVVLDGKTLDAITLPGNSTVESGFLESTSVDAVGEMVDVLAAERSFESAQKVVSAIDRTRERSSTDVARVK